MGSGASGAQKPTRLSHHFAAVSARYRNLRELDLDAVRVITEAVVRHGCGPGEPCATLGCRHRLGGRYLDAVSQHVAAALATEPRRRRPRRLDRGRSSSDNEAGGSRRPDLRPICCIAHANSTGSSAMASTPCSPCHARGADQVLGPFDAILGPEGHHPPDSLWHGGLECPMSGIGLYQDGYICLFNRIYG